MKNEQAWKESKRKVTSWDRWCAKVMSALLNKARAESLDFDFLNLSIPQSGCCFDFGPNKLPLPAGAILQLWSKDPKSTGDCPNCGGRVLAVAFGGLMSTGGYIGICVKCAAPMFNWIGGLGTVHRHVMPFLEGTPWFIKSGCFGGAIASNGVDLADALGLPEPPEATRSDEPVVKVSGNKMVLHDVTFDDNR